MAHNITEVQSNWSDSEDEDIDTDPERKIRSQRRQLAVAKQENKVTTRQLDFSSKFTLVSTAEKRSKVTAFVLYFDVYFNPSGQEVPEGTKVQVIRGGEVVVAEFWRAVEVEEVFSSAQVFSGQGRDNRAQAALDHFTRNAVGPSFPGVRSFVARTISWRSFNKDRIHNFTILKIGRS